MAQPTPARCGERISATQGDGTLTMRGTFAAQADRRGDGMFSGTVTVTNAGRAIAGVSSPEADVIVARAGEIVTEPLVKDLLGAPVALAAGASQTFPARGSLRRCGGSGTELLAAGSYEIYAVVVVTVEEGPGTGSTVTSVGGPWPLRVA